MGTSQDLTNKLFDNAAAEAHGRVGELDETDVRLKTTGNDVTMYRDENGEIHFAGRGGSGLSEPIAERFSQARSKGENKG